jgi:hypothetical protein
VPQALLEEITNQVDQQITSQFAAQNGNSNLIIESITISEGSMTITGRAR